MIWNAQSPTCGNPTYGNRFHKPRLNKPQLNAQLAFGRYVKPCFASPLLADLSYNLLGVSAHCSRLWFINCDGRRPRKCQTKPKEIVLWLNVEYEPSNLSASLSPAEVPDVLDKLQLPARCSGCSAPARNPRGGKASSSKGQCKVVPSLSHKR